MIVKRKLERTRKVIGRDVFSDTLNQAEELDVPQIKLFELTAE